MQEIKTAGLSKRYKNLIAVDNLDLEIKKGELFSLLGVNGAGKTTVIRMLSCLSKPTGICSRAIFIPGLPDICRATPHCGSFHGRCRPRC